MAALGRTTAALSLERLRSGLPAPRPRVQLIRLRTGTSDARSSGPPGAAEGSLNASAQTAGGSAGADLQAEHSERGTETGAEQPEPGKECVDCKQTLPRTEFRRQVKSRDGLQHSCRCCADKKAGREPMPPVTVASKKCGKCGKVKPRKSFGGSRSSKDGLRSHCTDCKVAADKIRRQANAERNRRLGVPGVEEKACTACGEVKPAKCFTRWSSSRDGLFVRCKECVSAAGRLRRAQLPTPTPPLSKICRICGVEKPGSEFDENKANSDGLQHECKACLAKYNREWRQRKKAAKAAAAAAAASSS